MTARLLYFFLLANFQLWSQNVIFYNNDSINAMDGNNRKIGFWKLYDLKRDITVSGEVKNDNQFAEADYFVDRKLFVSQKSDSILIFYNNGDRTKAILSRKNKEAPIRLENGEPIDRETKTKFFRSTEMDAMFYGGTKAIADYLKANTQPEIASFSGRVVIRFVVDINGQTTQLSVAESSSPVLSQEALRLVKKMPRWQPGFQQGHFVRVEKTLPIKFGGAE